MRASRLPGLTSGTGANTGGRSGGAGSGGRLRGAGTGGHFRGAGTGESGAPSGLDKGTRDEGGLDGTSGDDGERRGGSSISRSVSQSIRSPSMSSSPGCIISSPSATFTFTFTFMHLADAFIQSDLHCIQVTVFTFDQLLLSLGIEPMILALLAPCSTI